MWLTVTALHATCESIQMDFMNFHYFFMVAFIKYWFIYKFRRLESGLFKLKIYNFLYRIFVMIDVSVLSRKVISALFSRGHFGEGR